jgi:hypothetical protein
MPVIDLRMSSTQPLSLALAPPSQGLFLPEQGGTAPCAEIRAAPANCFQCPLTAAAAKLGKAKKKIGGRIDKNHKDVKSAGPISRCSTGRRAGNVTRGFALALAERRLTLSASAASVGEARKRVPPASGLVVCLR